VAVTLRSAPVALCLIFRGKTLSKNGPSWPEGGKLRTSFLTHSAVVRKHVKKTLPSGIGFKKHPRWLRNSASVNLGGGSWLGTHVANIQHRR